MEPATTRLKTISRDNITQAFLIILLLCLAAFLRFSNLSYSEFQDDEKKSMIKLGNYPNALSFLLNQRKGPMQFIVTSSVLAFTNDRQNELALRVPFTIFNLLSVVVFYLILKKLDLSNFASFIGSLIYLSNGFIVAFSRIAQYQSLNLFFSLLSLLFVLKLAKDKDHSYKNATLAAIFFGISFLSHWDAIFYLVPSAYFGFIFLKRKDVEQKVKVNIVKSAILAGALLILPFLLPFIYNQVHNQANLSYLNKRVGISSYSIIRHKMIFELYNPFVALFFLGITSFLAIFTIKKSWPFYVWFIFNFVLLKFFMDKPGTHVYNYVIPAIFLTSIGIDALISFFGNIKFIKIITVPVLIISIIAVVSFLYYQSFILFVDHKTEYPWEAKKVLVNKYINFVAKDYDDREVLTFGFPHYRNWKKVAEIINNDVANCTYVTNEGKEISQIYLPDNYGIHPKPRCLYIAVVMRPFINQRDGAVFAETSRKSPIYIYERNGEKLLKLYKIR